MRFIQASIIFLGYVLLAFGGFLHSIHDSDATYFVALACAAFILGKEN